MYMYRIVISSAARRACGCIRRLSVLSGEVPATTLCPWLLLRHRIQDVWRRRRTKVREITDIIIEFMRQSLRPSLFFM